MTKQALSAIRSAAGRKGGRAAKGTPSGFASMTPATREIISRMGVEARSKMPVRLRLDKRICYLDDCRAKPCPIRVGAFGRVMDFCCWSHSLVGISNELDKVVSN